MYACDIAFMHVCMCEKPMNSISQKKGRLTHKAYIKLPTALDIQALINCLCTYIPIARPTSKNGNEFDLKFSKQGPQFFLL